MVTNKPKKMKTDYPINGNSKLELKPMTNNQLADSTNNAVNRHGDIITQKNDLTDPINEQDTR